MVLEWTIWRNEPPASLAASTVKRCCAEAKYDWMHYPGSSADALYRCLPIVNLERACIRQYAKSQYAKIIIAGLQSFFQCDNAHSPALRFSKVKASPGMGRSWARPVFWARLPKRVAALLPVYRQREYCSDIAFLTRRVHGILNNGLVTLSPPSRERTPRKQ